MRGLCILLACCVAAVWPLAAQADEEVECEHAKLNTEDATPVDLGAWELSLSYSLTHARRAFADGGSRVPRPLLREAEVGIGLKYGLVENLDIGIGFGYVDVLDRSAMSMRGTGMTDVEIGAKWRFYHDEERRLEIAYTPAIVLPKGREGSGSRIGISDEFYSIFNGVAVTKDWSSRATSNFALGYRHPVGEDRDGYRGTLSADAAFGYHVTEALQPEIELNCWHDFMHGDDASALAATVGCIICVTDWMRLDVGIQRTLCGRNADHGTSFVASATFAF